MRQSTFLGTAAFFLLLGFQAADQSLANFSRSLFDPILGMAPGERALIVARFFIVYLAWQDLAALETRRFEKIWLLAALLLILSLTAKVFVWVFGLAALGFFIWRKILPRYAAFLVLLVILAPALSSLSPPAPQPTGELRKSELRAMTMKWIGAENYFYARHYAKLWVDNESSFQERTEALAVLADIDRRLEQSKDAPGEEP